MSGHQNLRQGTDRVGKAGEQADVENAFDAGVADNGRQPESNTADTGEDREREIGEDVESRSAEGRRDGTVCVRAVEFGIFTLDHG